MFSTYRVRPNNRTWITFQPRTVFECASVKTVVTTNRARLLWSTSVESSSIVAHSYNSGDNLSSLIALGDLESSSIAARLNLGENNKSPNLERGGVWNPIAYIS